MTAELALRLSITDRCDLRCLYCHPGGDRRLLPPQALLTFEEIDRAVRLLTRCGVTKVRLTGGEPLLRRGVEDLIRQLGRNRKVTWTLTTNGQRLATYVPVLREAGFVRVNISLDSLEQAAFRRLTGGGDLARTLEGSAASAAAGLAPVKWNTVVMRGRNLGEVAAFADATIHQPIHVRFIEYMPTRGREASWRERFVSATEITERIRRRHDLEPCLNEPHSPARLLRIPGARGRIGLIAPISAPFCHECNRLRLNAAGSLYACLSMTERLDLRSSFRTGRSDEAILEDLQAFVARKTGRRRRLPDRVVLAESMAAIGG